MARIRTIKPEKWASVQEAWLLGYALYVIQEVHTSWVKIGVASHPMRRLSMIQSGNPRRLVMREIYIGERADCRQIERAVHKRFVAKNIRGEWFSAKLSDVLVAIEEFAG